MSARGWIAIVAGALLVLAAWRSLRIERERPSSPAAPSPADAAGNPRVATAREAQEDSLEAAARRPALLREPELELRGGVVTTEGEPVAGATLTVVEPLLRQVPGLVERDEVVERTLSRGRSEVDGSFRFRLEPDRTYDLVARAKGFALTRIPNLYAGEEARVVLSRAAAIFGRVTDAVDGSPLAGVEIEAEPGPPQVSGAARFRATSDGYGTYRLEALPPGIYVVEVDARDHVRIWNGQVAVEDGEERRADFALYQGATIRGRVTDGETKAPIEGASVVLRGERDRRAALTDAEGRYVLKGVPVTKRDGTFVSLRIRAHGFGEFDFPISSVPEGGLEQDLFLLPGRRARGRVVGRDGSPVPDARILARASLADGTWQGDRVTATTDASGRFELADLRADLRHTLLVHAEGHATGVFDFPEAEWERREIDLGEIRLERPGAIAGRMSDAGGGPLGDGWVSLKGDPKRRGSLGPSGDGNQGYPDLGGLGFGDVMARTDERGRYAFTRLPAGNYRLTGMRSGCANLAHQAVELPEGGRILGADLVLDVGLSIEGVVVDKLGTPIPGASVRASREDNRGPSASAACGRSGTFTLSGLAPGDHAVSVSPSLRKIVRPDGEPRQFWQASAKGIAAGTSGLRLVLPEAQAITGTVLGPDGKPAPGAGGAFSPEGGEFGYGFTADQAGRFLIWADEGTRGTLLVRPPGFPVRDNQGQVDRRYFVTLENIAAGTKDLLVRLPRVP